MRIMFWMGPPRECCAPAQMEKECTFALDLSVQHVQQQQPEQQQTPSVPAAASGERRLSQGGAVGPAGIDVADAPLRDAREGDLRLNGTLVSANCGLELRLDGSTTHLAEHFAKAVRYTTAMTALALLQARAPPTHPPRPIWQHPRCPAASPAPASLRASDGAAVTLHAHILARHRRRVDLCCWAVAGLFFLLSWVNRHASVWKGRVNALAPEREQGRKIDFAALRRSCWRCGRLTRRTRRRWRHTCRC